MPDVLDVSMNRVRWNSRSVTIPLHRVGDPGWGHPDHGEPPLSDVVAAFQRLLG